MLSTQRLRVNLVDGKLAHLAKYSAGYKQMFPYSNQIVVASQADIFILPKFLIVSLYQLCATGF